MKCPHCQNEIPGSPCPECGSENPEGANYCMMCGALLAHPEKELAGDDEGLDFEDRTLCPDGTCTGIIVDGRCTECGRTEKEARESEEAR